jgi:hypothetical protein
MSSRRVPLSLSRADLDRLLESLDSHIYWQLSDDAYRNSGHVLGDGSSDPETRAEIRRCERLVAHLEAARRVNQEGRAASGRRVRSRSASKTRRAGPRIITVE